jgi:palmitoyltransferase ZDHHC9/14/18
MSEQKLYSKWPGMNKFYCDGRLMTGYFLHSPDGNRALITFFLILIPGLLFFAQPAVYFLQAHQNPAPLLIEFLFLILSLSFLAGVSLKNPGFIPKQWPPFAVGPFGARPLEELIREAFNPKELPIDGHLTRLKYCATCNIIRPPRCSHCSDCGVCVERFDHHCPWVGNCVAKRNYREFIGFLSSTSLLAFSTLGFSAYHVADASKKNGVAGIDAFNQGVQGFGVSIALIAYSFIVSNR